MFNSYNTTNESFPYEKTVNIEHKHNSSTQDLIKLNELKRQIESEFFDGCVRQTNIEDIPIEFVSINKKSVFKDDLICILKINGVSVPFEINSRKYGNELSADILRKLLNALGTKFIESIMGGLKNV